MICGDRIDDLSRSFSIVLLLTRSMSISGKRDEDYLVVMTCPGNQSQFRMAGRRSASACPPLSTYLSSR